MGIQGLLPFLAESTREAHISEFENEFVAIDAYCWLHKGIYSCAYELAVKKPTVKYVTYCMRYIEMLLHFNVKPVLVFDGRQLSSKRETEKKRREERKKKYERGRELMRAGNVQEGRKLLGESVDVTHEMALKLIEECRAKNIDSIVAPYEADAQLAFLSVRNIVKCIITEDSDLLAYGCEMVMFKMDKDGRGKLIQKSDIHLSLKMSPEEFNDDLFRYMCILSGCDYLPSLESIGPANALKFVKILRGNDIYDVLPRLPIYLNKMKVSVTPEYLKGFRVADNTFKHQLVYDPFQRLQVPLRPASNADDVVGTKLPDDLAFELAVGNINPMTMERLSNYNPDETGKGFSILWRTDSLPNATSRQSFGSSLCSQISTTKHRQNENAEYSSVTSITNDLKKQWTPCNLPNFRDSSKKNGVPKIPECGFVFEPKIESKTVSNVTNEPNLLKSRYFSRPKHEKKKKETETANDRRKDEGDEEYLQRLYNEFFPPVENESGALETRKGGGGSVTGLEGTCLCGKDHGSCTCYDNSTSVSDGRTLGESISDGEEFSKSKGNSVQHFLLDEIYNQMETTESLAEGGKLEEEKQCKVSPSQSLSFNFSKILSKLTETPKSSPEDSKTVEAVEKENAEVMIIGEQESARPPSPVFKIQRGVKVLKRNFRLGNISDTAGTPTSVYFVGGSERLNESNPQVSSKCTSSRQRMPSVRSFSSVPSSKTGRNSVKGSSVNRTLFQFGFKKRRREDAESEATEAPSQQLNILEA